MKEPRRTDLSDDQPLKFSSTITERTVELSETRDGRIRRTVTKKTMTTEKEYEYVRPESVFVGQCAGVCRPDLPSNVKLSIQGTRGPDGTGTAYDGDYILSCFSGSAQACEWEFKEELEGGMTRFRLKATIGEEFIDFEVTSLIVSTVGPTWKTRATAFDDELWLTIDGGNPHAGDIDWPKQVVAKALPPGCKPFQEMEE